MLGPGEGLLVELPRVVLAGVPVVAVVVEFGLPCCSAQWVQGFHSGRCNCQCHCLLKMRFCCMLVVLGIGWGLHSVWCLVGQNPGYQC